VRKMTTPALEGWSIFSSDPTFIVIVATPCRARNDRISIAKNVAHVHIGWPAATPHYQFFALTRHPTSSFADI
jgi:hypothetical protein